MRTVQERDAACDPALSVVLATPDGETIARGLTALSAQTARARIEVVLVSLSGESLGVLLPRLDEFAAHRIVEPGFAVSLAAGRAMGVRAATGRYVHIGETHSFPHPDWAERIIDSLDERWTAIVSGHENANADNVISWANLVTDYGPWLAHLPAGEIASTPPYNTAFERSFALRAVELSEDAFTGSFDLTALLRAGGHHVLFQPAARIDHVNVSVGSHWLGQRYTAAGARAGRRSRDWPWWRRVVYALGAPLIPLILAARLARPLLATERAWRLPRLTAPAMLLGLAAQACGEFAAFVTGERADVARRADEFELYKVRYSGLSLDPPSCVIAGRSSGSSGRAGKESSRPVALTTPSPRGAHRPGEPARTESNRVHPDGERLPGPDEMQRPRKTVDPG